MVLGIGVAPGDVVFELALDVAKERGGANAEQVGLEGFCALARSLSEAKG